MVADREVREVVALEEALILLVARPGEIRVAALLDVLQFKGQVVPHIPHGAENELMLRHLLKAFARVVVVLSQTLAGRRASAPGAVLQIGVCFLKREGTDLLAEGDISAPASGIQEIDAQVIETVFAPLVITGNLIVGRRVPVTLAVVHLKASRQPISYML